MARKVDSILRLQNCVSDSDLDSVAMRRWLLLVIDSSLLGLDLDRCDTETKDLRPIECEEPS